MKTGITIQMAEHICGYCQKPYIAKRTDANYCSHSCRQLAYMQRKLKNPPAKPQPVKTVVNGSPKTTVITKRNQSPQNEASNELAELLSRRNNIRILQSLLYDPNPRNPSLWVSTRYKYLVECLLDFAQAPTIYLNDLREVLSAFISIQQSTYFICLPIRYPYSREIREFSYNLKSFCMTTEIDEPFKFELTKATKLQLMAIDCELEAFIPKSSYSQLSFTA